jgi:3-dehydroquinate synthase
MNQKKYKISFTNVALDLQKLIGWEIINTDDLIIKKENRSINKTYKKIENWLPKASKILVITDTNVSKIYSLPYLTYKIPAGEKHKNLKEIEKIYKFCAEAGLDRNSLIIALGGGVVGDMAGFVAATYLRGIRFVQIPTTLLAQVDASIGGKTGVDLECGKNLVGAFHQPEMVWIDPEFLKTLDEREYKNGLAEVIKYGFISEFEFWQFLDKNIDKILNRDIDTLKKMLSMCVKIKTEIVSQDEEEGHLRKILNFGHTLGHAIEVENNYSKVKHGEAIATGMLFASFVAKKLNICDENISQEIEKMLGKIGFKIFKIKDIDRIIGFMAHDKKSFGGKIDFILPEELGKVKIVPLDLKEIKKYLKEWKKIFFKYIEEDKRG